MRLISAALIGLRLMIVVTGMSPGTRLTARRMTSTASFSSSAAVTAQAPAAIAEAAQIGG